MGLAQAGAPHRRMEGLPGLGPGGGLRNNRARPREASWWKQNTACSNPALLGRWLLGTSSPGPGGRGAAISWTEPFAGRAPGLEHRLVTKVHRYPALPRTSVSELPPISPVAGVVSVVSPHVCSAGLGWREVSCAAALIPWVHRALCLYLGVPSRWLSESGAPQGTDVTLVWSFCSGDPSGA